MVFRRNEHDKQVRRLASRLNKKHYIDFLAVNHEYYRRGTMSPCGEMDVISFSPLRPDDRRVLTYWEVKTGDHHSGYSKAINQARRFYDWASASYIKKHFIPRFVYINTHEDIITHIRSTDLN